MPLDAPSDFKSSILQLAAVTFELFVNQWRAIWDSDCDRNPIPLESPTEREFLSQWLVWPIQVSARVVAMPNRCVVDRRCHWNARRANSREFALYTRGLNLKA